MLIEADARRFITEAIENEKELSLIEQRDSRGYIGVYSKENQIDTDLRKN
jgi:hypothetical protein